jgi:hypothetical protein
MTNAILHKDNFARAFDELNQLLIRYQQIWHHQPFTDDNLPWLLQYPALHDALLALTEQQLAAFEDEQNLFSWMADYLPGLQKSSSWQTALFDGPLYPMAKFADTGIPGRKKQQIVAFSSAISQNFVIKGPIVDWCSGKGHLARQMNQLSSQAVTCLEYDAKLCKDGEALSAAKNCNVHFIQQDVMQPIAHHLLTDAVLHTALHACGELHVQMLKTAVAMNAANIACVPCCYHLSKGNVYQALCKSSRQSQLQLDKTDLRLAVLQTVTGGQRVRRLREQELLWRIAFDLLQRQISGLDQYQSTPSINKQYLSGSFIDYAMMMASRTQLTLPLQLDVQQLLVAAKNKYHIIIRLEKARLAFRKALEYWLILDRILYVQEQGYDVKISSFCPSEISPRNTLILATKKEQ